MLDVQILLVSIIHKFIKRMQLFYYCGDPVTWVDLNSQGVSIPFKYGHTANPGGPNQDSIFIIGGVYLSNTNLVYQLDTKTNKLSVPVTQGNPPLKSRIFMGSAS